MEEEHEETLRELAPMLESIKKRKIIKKFCKKTQDNKYFWSGVTPDPIPETSMTIECINTLDQVGEIDATIQCFIDPDVEIHRLKEIVKKVMKETDENYKEMKIDFKLGEIRNTESRAESISLDFEEMGEISNVIRKLESEKRWMIHENIEIKHPYLDKVR